PHHGGRRSDHSGKLCCYKGHETVSKASDRKPALTPEQQEAVAAIRARSKHDRPGPDELIDRGEIDELIPHAQFMELRTLTAQLRRLREEQGLSLTDVS